jgi:hypothetical protein
VKVSTSFSSIEIVMLIFVVAHVDADCEVSHSTRACVIELHALSGPDRHAGRSLGQRQGASIRNDE